MILADTSVIIDAQRKPQSLSYFYSIYPKIYISRITGSELICGARNTVEKNRNKKFVEYFPVLEVTEDISLFSYRLLDKYCLTWKLGIQDAIIAATAMKHKLLLWTKNTKHFEKITDLRFFQPQ